MRAHYLTEGDTRIRVRLWDRGVIAEKERALQVEVRFLGKAGGGVFTLRVPMDAPRPLGRVMARRAWAEYCLGPVGGCAALED